MQTPRSFGPPLPSMSGAFPTGMNRYRATLTGVSKGTIRRVLESLGWTWTPTMAIGSGCKVDLRDGELPQGRLIVSVSKHMVAVIDGVIHDTHDPSRDGTLKLRMEQPRRNERSRRCKEKKHRNLTQRRVAPRRWRDSRPR
jgi:hypothetical protein